MWSTTQKIVSSAVCRRTEAAAISVSARLLLAILLLLPLAAVHAQESDTEARAEVLLSIMSVEERVGQLFLVAFVGNDPSPGTDIAQLVRQDHVGGVVLLAANSNFHSSADTPRRVAELTNGLQGLVMDRDARVPLFIAVDHEGDGYPYTRITGGTTPLPNAMAIGATWDLAAARDVGQITGLELAAMGINLLLGPSVDVLNNPNPSGQGDIGTRTFGGDPAWVGEMGRAYIEGVHQGSGGRVATVAKHFPGHGGSDRLPDEEVATVDKSIEELKRVELAPFIEIVRDDGAPGAVTDALMPSHIRYRGFQGDIRQFTAPISFDPEAMEAILALEEFAGWRQSGLMVSDSLGVPAVRKYFDPTLSTFPHRRIAKEAFLAGNDLLLLSQFDLSNVWADQLANIHDTIAFFRAEYRSNPDFAARVDDAVVRILQLKLNLYPEFTLEAVQVHPDAALQVCGLGTQVTQRIANQAITLLYPDANALPPAPRQGEEILIFSDARPVRECFTEQCQIFSPLGQTAVEEAILKAYGSEGTGQIQPENITSLPFGQLKKLLQGEETEVDVKALLEQADWIIFAQQDLNPIKGPNSDTVKIYLNHSLSASQAARLVVLAFNAPYYLDTTEISKLSLYLAAYSKVEPFVGAATRVLFRELAPHGSSPVDIEATNYDLQRQLGPDPEQVIPVRLLDVQAGESLEPPTSVRVQAGPIKDHNGRLVRDGLQVTFYAEYFGGAYVQPLSAATSKGLAEAAFALSEPGQVRFRVESGEAQSSQFVSLDIQAPPTVVPTPSPRPTATPTDVPEETPIASPQPTLAPSPTAQGTDTPGSSGPVDGIDLALAIGTVLLVAAVGSWSLGERRKDRVYLVRWALLAICGGMVAYCLYALLLFRPELRGQQPAGEPISRAAMLGIVVVGTLLPLVIRWFLSRAHRS